MLSFNKLVCIEDWAHETETLDKCYANLVQSKAKDTAQLKKFLNNLVRNFIFSNNKLNKSADGSVQLVKAAGDTKFIIGTLFKRVELFKKFEGAPDCYLQLFNQPLSMLVGDQKFVIQKFVDVRTFFENNGLFLRFVFNALSKAQPKLNFSGEFAIEISESVVAFADPGNTLFLGKQFDFRQMFQKLSLGYGKDFPHWVKVVSGSFPTYVKISLEFSKILTSRHNQQTELALQKKGQIPLLCANLLDPNDVLAHFRVDKTIEPSFKLTSEETALIQGIFNYPLDSEIRMLDILGFALYDKLEKLKNIIPQLNKNITETQGMVSAYFILLFAGLCRSSPGTLKRIGTINELSERFVLFPHTFSKIIDKELDGFQEAVKNIKLNSRHPNQSQKKVLKANQNKILGQFNTTVLPILNLLIKFLQSKGSVDLLLKEASKYQGNEALNQNHNTGRIIVKQYWNFVKSGFLSGIKSGFIGNTFNLDRITKNDLPFSPHPLEKEMRAFGIAIVEETFLYDKKSESYKEALEGMSDGLVHKIESHWTQYSFIRLYLLFLSDMLRLVEKRIFPQGTLTTKSCCFRLKYNMSMNRAKSVNEHPSSLLPSTIPPKFKMILDPIQTEFKQHSELFNYAYASTDTQGGFFNHGRWLEFLLPIETSITALFENSLQTLSSLKVELLQELRSEWSSLTLEQLQSLDSSAVKEAIFQEGLQLLRPLLILSDMLALLQKRHFSEEAAIIPLELADVMELDGIDEILEMLIKAKTPQPVILAPSLPVAAEEPLLPSIQKAAVVRQKKTAPAKRVIRQNVPISSAPLQSEAQSEIQDLARLTKSREILKRLKALNFFEDHQTGSHHILKGPQGGTVVVPNNNNLPRGTRSSIAEQVTKALGI